MKENTTTETLLESQHTPLSRDKKEALWKNIEADIMKLPIASPYTFTMVTKKSMTSIALALVLMFSLGGTAYASNDARPGDILFPIDQALEEIRLALVRDDDSRAQLQIAFAEERLNELRSILAERNNGQSTASTTATTTVATFEAEADVFTNTTIVTVEINDRKTTFETSAKTKSAVVDEIVRRYNVDRSRVEQALDFEIEDRASRVSDVSVSNDDDDRVTTSITLLSQLIDDGDDDSRDRFISELMQAFGGDDYDDDFRFEQDDDEIEFRSDDNRVRIREKDGETRIEIRSDDDRDDDSSDDREDDDARSSDDDSDSNNDDDDSNSNSSDDSSSDDNSSDDSNDDSSDDSDNQVKIEVRVEDGQAEVRMEYGSKRDEFTTSYITTAALVIQLAARSGLSQSVIENNLDLEIED